MYYKKEKRKLLLFFNSYDRAGVYVCAWAHLGQRRDTSEITTKHKGVVVLSMEGVVVGDEGWWSWWCGWYDGAGVDSGGDNGCRLSAPNTNPH